MKNIWIIIPAHNEEKHISDVIKKAKIYSKNIVVVDDGSTDNTYKIAKEQCHVLKHIVNLGKGAALKTGCEYALTKKADIMIVIDSDGQHNPKGIPKLLKALKNKDIVFSYRKFQRKMPLIKRIGNILINKTIKILYGIKLRDTQCGYKAFKSDAYKKIRWVSRGYTVESEIIANAGKNKLKYTEIPIQTIYSDKYKGTSVIDGIKIVLNMLWWKIAALYGNIIK